MNADTETQEWPTPRRNRGKKAGTHEGSATTTPTKRGRTKAGPEVGEDGEPVVRKQKVSTYFPSPASSPSGPPKQAEAEKASGSSRPTATPAKMVMTRDECTYIFDSMIDNGKWTAWTKDLNTKNGTDRLPFSVKRHWKTFVRGALLKLYK